VIRQHRTYAPIVLFVYNRPWHTRQTVEALQRNELAAESELFIYSDAARTAKDQVAVEEVRDYICSISGFKKIEIIEQENNLGLADSIIGGVTEIVNKYGRVIVLEDDLVTSPYFLKYMNDALTFYENEKEVWHISGWNYPINLLELEDVFFWDVMNCWGWGTWSDRWQNFEKDAGKVVAEFNHEMIYKFDLDGTDVFWSQLVANKEGRLNTWAIFWYASIFLKDGMCLNPSRSFVRNIGHDGSGVHCGIQKGDDEEMSVISAVTFPTTITRSELARERIKEYYKNKKAPLYIRVLNLFLRIKKKLFK